MYRKSYFCVCAGQQEEMYLKHLAQLLKKPNERGVTFNTTVGSAELLRRNYTEYDKAVLFDHDFNEVEFERNIKTCVELDRESQKKRKRKGERIYHAYSNVNFDLWLILHKEDYTRPVTRTDAYVDEVRRVYGLDPEADIKNRDVIKKILDQIELNDVKEAIRRAERIRAGKLECDGFYVCSEVCYNNPDFSIHKFLKDVLEDCGEL